MPRYKFLGTDACPDEITLRDVTFEKGKAVKVDDGLAAKLANLDYFAEVKQGRPKKDDKDGE